MHDDLAAVSCHACGVYDASLRHSVHPSVVSTLVRANESARVGIWCARCRGIEAAKAATISLLAGWWSIRGPGLTIAALRTNLRGGDQRPGTNAEMLRGIARLQYGGGNPELASMFARAAHAMQPQRENSRLLDELNRGGYRHELPASPWRFAPFAPVVVVAIVLLSVAWNALPEREEPVDPLAPVQRATLVPPKPPAKARRTYEQQLALRESSADELQKQLTSKFDRELAHAYVQARLREARSEIPGRVRRGDDLRAIQYSIAAFATHPGVAPLINEPGQKASYEDLAAVFHDSTRYYRGGASIEAMERTAGESFNVSVDIAVDAIISDMQGNTERTGALMTEVHQRAQSVAEMKQDVRVRAAVIALTQKAIDRCLDSSIY
jgi:hypothetical protein